MMIANRSWSRVAWRCWLRMFFCSWLKNDFIAALSAQVPTRPIDPGSRCPRGAARKACDRSWLFLSECATVATGRWRRSAALLIASPASCAVMRAFIE